MAADVVKRWLAVPPLLIQTTVGYALLAGAVWVVLPPQLGNFAAVAVGVVWLVAVVRTFFARVVREDARIRVVNRWRTVVFDDADAVRIDYRTPWWTPVTNAGLPTVVVFDDGTARTPVLGLGFMTWDRAEAHPDVKRLLGEAPKRVGAEGG